MLTLLFVVVVGSLAFALLAPNGTLSKVTNFVGGLFQSAVSKVKGLFKS